MNSNGVVTVAAAANVGQVQICATYGDLSCYAQLILRKESLESDNNIELSAITGEKNYVSFVADNTSSFIEKTFTLNYDPLLLTPTDLCALTSEKETVPCSVSQVGITITNVSSGQITFSVNKEISANNTWSGLVNLFEFTAIADGSTSVSFTQTTPAS